jgi:uncharacterized phage protein gp47/JayE
MAGLTSAGLNIKRVTDVRVDLRRKAVEFFNDLVPEGEVLDTSSASTVGRLIGLVSPSEADLWESLLEVYLAFDPNSASGIALDNLVALSGIVRKGASSSTAQVLLTGSYNVTIPSGSLVSSSYTNVRFTIPTEVVLDENGVVGFVVRIQTVQDSTAYTVTYNDGTNSVDLTYTSSTSATAVEIVGGLATIINDNYGSVLTATAVADTLEVASDDLVSENGYVLSANLFFTKVTKGRTISAAESGPLEQETGTIDTISTPIFGWDTVEQFQPAVIGSFRESDTELRNRFSLSKFVRGSNILDAMYSNLISLNGVQNVTIYENTTNVVDALGIPPHAFMVLIRGGLEQEITEVIWNNRPTGIPSFGNSFALIEDVFGNEKQVYFRRPAFVDVYVSVSLTTNFDFPADGVEQIRSALFEYIKSSSNVGDAVVYSRLYTPLNSVVGHQVDALTVGFSSSPTGTSNLAFAFDEIAKLEIGNIEVTIV